MWKKTKGPLLPLYMAADKMKITITTTEKKLTLSLLKQMESLPYRFFDKCEVLGYLTANIRKSTNRLALCHMEGEYYLHNMLWELKGSESDRGLHVGYFRNGSAYAMHPEKPTIKDWFEKHQKICRIAEEIHIYV